MKTAVNLIFRLLCVSLLLLNMTFSQNFPFQNPELSITQRTEDLISRMTLEEKVSQLLYTSGAIDRLGIPEYNWWNECLHGVARNGRATVFPQAIGLAATFDSTLLYEIGRAISMEARAKYNVSVAHGYRGRYHGLTFWSPNVNIFRDPRWGRGQETYGEDPYLTSRMGVAFVEGLQGDHPHYLQAAGMAKHFAVHSGPEALRHEFDARVSRKDLWETYLPVFEALVTEAEVEGVMGAYNRTNGDPCCAHPYLMQDILRGKWDFGGYYVSDCWAIVDFVEGHNLVETRAEAAAMALIAGTNLNCGDTYQHVLEAIEQELVNEAVIDDNLKQLLPTRFRLGLFDPPGTVPFDTIGTEWIRHPKHTALSLQAAEKSIVLLKNNDQILPIDPNIGSVFVCGPTATHVQSLLANYYGVSEDLKTILEGVVANVSSHTSVTYQQGALLDEENRNPKDWFSETAAESDVTIACIGISQLMEGEEGESIMSRHLGDREEISLPQNQIEFLKTIREKAKTLVVVVTGGSAIACPEVYEMADALLFAWYPGEQGGLAVGNIIFGLSVPSGKLPVTFPKSVEDLPPYDDYAMANRTYRYMEAEPLFPFGFGLSYTTFAYDRMYLSTNSPSSEEPVTVHFSVENQGELAAEEVVQVYVSDLDATVDVPNWSLRKFQRVSLAPGEQRDLVISLDPEDFMMVNENGERVLEPGDFIIYVGGSLPSQRSLDLGAPQFQQAKLRFE